MERFQVFGIAFGIMLLVIAVLFFPIIYRGSVEDIEITVIDKERIATGSGDAISHKYLVFSEDEVFQNTDSVLFLKFNSADVQGKLDRGGSYRVTVAGWRKPVLSWYRNIVKVHQ